MLTWSPTAKQTKFSDSNLACSAATITSHAELMLESAVTLSSKESNESAMASKFFVNRHAHITWYAPRACETRSTDAYVRVRTPHPACNTLPHVTLDSTDVVTPVDRSFVHFSTPSHLSRCCEHYSFWEILNAHEKYNSSKCTVVSKLQYFSTSFVSRTKSPLIVVVYLFVVFSNLLYRIAGIIARPEKS